MLKNRTKMKKIFLLLLNLFVRLKNNGLKKIKGKKNHIDAHRCIELKSTQRGFGIRCYCVPILNLNFLYSISAMEQVHDYYRFQLLLLFFCSLSRICVQPAIHLCACMYTHIHLFVKIFLFYSSVR